MNPAFWVKAIQATTEKDVGAFFRAVKEAPAMLSGRSSEGQSQAVNVFEQRHAGAMMRDFEKVMESL